MNYIEWKTELKDHLLSVSEAERQRVLDYYAEAYADRRDAGMSEKKIIEEFGAPYDAARRILAESEGADFTDEGAYTPPVRTESREEPRRKAREERREKPRSDTQPSDSGRDDYTWVFVLLCVIFAFPLFALIMGMVGVTVGFCIAPLAMIIGGGGVGGVAIAAMILGGPSGLPLLGAGIIAIGLGVALAPLFFKLVGLMWKAFGKLFAWIKGLFSGKGGNK